MIKMTLKNTFHNTEARVVVNMNTMTVSARSLARASRDLCGMADCRCEGHGGAWINGDPVDIIDANPGNTRVRIQFAERS